MTRRRVAKPRLSRALAFLLAVCLVAPISLMGFPQTSASAGQDDLSLSQSAADADADGNSASGDIAPSREGALGQVSADGDATEADAESDDASVSAQADMALADEGDYISDDKVVTAADGATDSLRPYSTQNPTVFFYASIGGEWRLVTSDGKVWEGDEASYKNDNGVNHGYVTRYIDPSWGGPSGRARYFMTGQPLVRAYGALAGFDVSQIRGDYYWAPGADTDKGYILFANTTSDSRGKSTIWADTRPWYDKSGEVATTYSDPGRWHIPLRCENNDGSNKNKDIYVYYLPNNKDGQDGCFNGSMSVSSESLMAINALCPVTVSDAGNLIYARDEQRPGVSYAPINNPAIFTVKNPDLSLSPDTVIWRAHCEGQDDDLPLVEVSRDAAAGTITYKTSGSITGPVTVYAANPNVSSYSISYRAATTADYRSKIGSLSADTIHLVPVDGNEDGYDDAEHHPDGLIDGAVQGQGSLSGIVHGNADGDYTVLSPDDDVVVLYHHTGGGASEKNRHYRMKFVGWRAFPSGELMQPGDVLSVHKLAQLAAYGSTVSFEAVWSLFDANGRVSSANFYVNCNSEVADVRDEGFRPTPASDFTNSIWTSRVEGTEGVSFDGNGDAVLIASESAFSAYSVNQTIKNSMTEPIEPGVTLERFPSDEEILGKLRAWLRSSAGHTITTQAGDVIAESDLTTERFTVRWYSVKYQHADGWHVDGILVAKAGALAVSKTFEGDPDAINKVLDKYSVSVTHEEATSTLDDAGDGEGAQTETVEDYVLKCVPAGDSSLEGHPDWLGYSSYSGDIDAGGNPSGVGTYTWVLSARAGRTYAVQENGYLYDDSDSYGLIWENSYWYMIRNADSESSGSAASPQARWSAYAGAPISVTAHSYATDVPTDAYQCVAFRNIYVRPGLLVASETDSATGNALKNVAFTLCRVERSGADAVERAVSLYRKPGTREYSAQYESADAAAADGYTEAVAASKVETGQNGLFFLDLPVAGEDGSTAIVYRLKEAFPTGYHGADIVDFTIDASGKIETIASQAAGGAPVPGDGEWAWGVGTNALKMTNESEAYDSLTAKKVWAQGSKARPVTVELWRNGARMSDILASAGAAGATGVSFEQTLSEENGWSCTWSDLPLFIDGEPATYSLRETWIGDVSYSPEADESDGYSEYVVSHDAPLYGAQGGAESAEGEKRDSMMWTDAVGKTCFAKSALLVVNNAEVQGDIVFSKKDRTGNDGKPLAGAVFKLYADEACTRELAEAVSDAAGTVRFASRAAGEYYVKEVSAPTGYSFFDETYRVRISGGDTTITRLGDDSAKPVNSIVNKLGVALSVFKTNTAAREGLPGARFVLLKRDKASADADSATYEQVGGVFVTNEEGFAASLDGLLGVQIEEPGSYVLREIEAPAGYEISDPYGFAFSVETDEAGETTMRATGIAADSPYTLVDTSKKDDSGKVENLSYRLTVIDEATYSLPTTGGRGVVPSWLLGVSLMCAACCMWRVRANRRESCRLSGGSRKKGWKEG